jgi:hypothetical protein
MKASTVASTTVVATPQPKSVARTIPSTSPIAQPKRQWRVALNARRLSDELLGIFTGASRLAPLAIPGAPSDDNGTHQRNSSQPKSWYGAIAPQEDPTSWNCPAFPSPLGIFLQKQTIRAQSWRVAPSRPFSNSAQELETRRHTSLVKSTRSSEHREAAVGRCQYEGPRHWLCRNQAEQYVSPCGDVLLPPNDTSLPALRLGRRPAGWAAR